MSSYDEMEILADIARAYYISGDKQSDIAKNFNISRSLVSRYLTKARELGIVEIAIHDYQTQTNRTLEKILKETLALKDVICVVDDRKNHILNRVAVSAANYLLKKIKSDSVVAIASGTTIAEVANAVTTLAEYPNVTFVSMVGGFGKLPNNIQSNVVGQVFASKLHAQALSLHAPVLVDSVEAKNVIVKQSFISEIMTVAKKADIALIGIGGHPAESSLAQAYEKNVEFRNDRNYHKIVGDIGYNFIDGNGKLVDCGWNDRVIAMNLDDIEMIENVVCVASGSNKVPSIMSAIKGGLIDTLIIDEVTANSLVKKIRKNE